MIATDPQIYLGDWDLTRSISSGCTASGRARIFSCDTRHMKYSEDVVLQLQDGTRIDGSRRYLLDLRPHSLDMIFDDGPGKGTLFQSFVLGGHAPSRHDCGADCYLSQWTWQSPDIFMVTHAVKGPRKDYFMQTTYKRLAR